MKASMGHRERLLRSVERRDIDRPAAFFRAEPCVRRRLCEELRLEDDAKLAEYFGADAVHIGVPYRRELLRQSDEPDTFYGIFGSKFRNVSYGDISSEVVVEPVLAGGAGDIDSVPWPGPELLDLPRAEREASQARESGLAVYGGVWASIFSHSRFMLGEEEYLVSLVSRPKFIARLVERLTDCYLELNQAYLSRCAKYLDIYYFGSDFGAQDSMFVSRPMFTDIFKPNLKRIADQAKGFDLKVMYHTCGAVREIIPDLIDCGVDILDPVQVSARGMEPAELARDYKGRIGFHGGISTQQSLPSGTPDEIEMEVRRAIDTLGPLGYIVSPDQDLISDVPTANIEALFRAVREYRI